MQKIRIRRITMWCACALLAALSLCASAKTTYCQQTPNSTQTQETDEERRRRLVESLERAQDEVKAARAYIPELEKSVKSKQAIIDAQAQQQTLSDEAIDSLKKEVAAAQAVIESQKREIATGGAEIDRLKSDLDKTDKKLSRSRKFAKYLTVAAGVLLVTTILK